MARQAHHSLMIATSEGTWRELCGVWRICKAVLLYGPGLTLVAREWDAVPGLPTAPVTPVSHGTSQLQSRSWEAAHRPLSLATQLGHSVARCQLAPLVARCLNSLLVYVVGRLTKKQGR